MTVAFAWIDGTKATEAEQMHALNIDAPRTTTEGQLFGALHLYGAHHGELYVVCTVPTSNDYSANYKAALEALLAADKRIRSGHAFRIGIL